MNTLLPLCLKSNKHAVIYPFSPYVASLWNMQKKWNIEIGMKKMIGSFVVVSFEFYYFIHRYRMHHDQASGLGLRLSHQAMPALNTAPVPNSLIPTTIWHSDFQSVALDHGQYPTQSNCTRPKTISPLAIGKSSIKCWHHDHFATAWKKPSWKRIPHFGHTKSCRLKIELNVWIKIDLLLSNCQIYYV